MTTLRSMVHPLPKEFTFAGFTFPKYVFTLPRGSMAKRLEQARNPVGGHYYHLPKPSQAGKGFGFYLESDGKLGIRWKWADEVKGARVKHTGWYSDKHGQAEKIRGLVMRLPKGRGFLAGWSMGEGMASAVDCDIFETEKEAAWGADSIAENVAELERGRNGFTFVAEEDAA